MKSLINKLFFVVFLILFISISSDVIIEIPPHSNRSVQANVSSQLFNFTINNTEENSIIRVNITLPNGFNYVSDSANTNALFESFEVYENTLSWYNSSGLISDLSYTQENSIKYKLTKKLKNSRGEFVGRIKLLKDGVEVPESSLKSLPRGKYDLIAFDNKGFIRINGINITKDLNIEIWIDEYKENNKPKNAIISTPIIVFNDSEVEFDNATIVLRKNGVTNVLLHCKDWDFINFNCLEWESPIDLVLSSGQNETHIWFTVKRFAAWGAGGLTCDEGDLNSTCLIGTSVTIPNLGVISGTGNLLINGTGELTAAAGERFFINMGGWIKIESGGKITGNVNITATNLIIEPGGKIDVSAKGYLGGSVGANGQGPGRGIHGSSYAGSGAGYGGKGGNDAQNDAGGDSYGSITQPIDFGSGGGGSYS
ncbi:MAG: polymer-forming cytoskeletal protein, partial [Candidatus Aenigmatarchaeota archaeon]